MFWLILGCVLQVFIVPIFMCYFKRDFSVERVIESTLGNAGLVYALLPVVAMIVSATISQIITAYIILIFFYFLLSLGIERFWIINWRYLLGINLVSFFVVYSMHIIDFGAYINIIILISSLLICAKILASLLSLKRDYNYYFMRYVRHSLKNLENKFLSKVASLQLGESQQKVLWALMLVENANNPKPYRLMERVIFGWTKAPMTTGIMQVYSTEYLSDNDSIEKAAEIVRRTLPKKETYSKKDINRIGLIYNGENEYCDVLYVVYQNLT